jgi:hypothetical protein
MQSIPPALAGLASFAQFVVYILVPSQTRPGKTDKFPVDWRSGRVANAHDASIWTTFDNALATVANGVGHGVGFVFTPADPFFFIDIDEALQPDGSWSPLANYLCAAFPGAAIEVSSSGRGLHIIGSGAAHAPLGHRCKNASLGLEFYTTERFVALTGMNAVGDVRADMGVVLPWLLANYFQPSADTVAAEEFTDKPRDDWNGPTDDDDLIRRALQSQSAASAFGSKASFADLWEGNVEALRKFWPDANAADGYDASSADAALASHLAFWTGCNGERMERIMRRSALVRDKWERDDYLRKFTIPRACSVQRDVCRDKPIEAPGLGAATPTPAAVQPEANNPVKTGETFLHPAAQLQLFAGCVYIIEAHRVLLPNGAIVKPEQFKTVFGGYCFVMDHGNEKTTRNAWEAFTESQVNVCPKADLTCFRPDLPTGSVVTHDGRRYANVYAPIATARMPGDISPFLLHLRKLLPVERDQIILLSYMAACVQHKGVKFQWAPLLQGAEGNGKTLFSRCVAYAVGERYTHWPRADQIAAKFNAWLEGKLFIGVEDVYMPDDRGEIIEIVKPMITNDRQPIEAKGVDQRTAWVCCNFILNSNHKDAVRKTRGDRRFAQFYTAQQDPDNWIERDGMGGDYFPRLYDWLKHEGGYAMVSELLHTYAIPDEFNPATKCSRAPDTSSTEEAISASLGGVEQEILESVEAGMPGFCNGWISSFAVQRLLEKLGRARTFTPRKREQTLHSLGYVRHPGLHGGRVNNPVLPDNGKPVLFVRMGSPEAAIVEPAEIGRAYSVAQGVALG